MYQIKVKNFKIMQFNNIHKIMKQNYKNYNLKIRA